MGNSLSSEWMLTFQNIKDNHDKAYHIIEEAISLEEQEKPNEAIEKYKEGIGLIDQALSVQVTMPENADFRWEQACRMIQKMKKTRGEVLTRIHCIQSAPSFVQHEPPPSYEESMETPSASNNVPQTYSELARALGSLAVELKDANVEVIYSYDNVKLYFISPNGTVSQTSEPQRLVIGLIAGSEGVSPKYFLQVGAWIYPLLPGVSPCYRTDYGAFILPDVHSQVQGASVGLILPEEADPSVYDILESILHGILGQTPTLQKIRKDISETISEKIVSGATYLSEGLIKGAQKASDYLNKKTPEIIQKITPAEEPAPISRKVSKTVEVAHTASTTAANVTGYVADKVSLATQALGHYLAPHIEKQGTKLLKTGFKMSEEEARSKVNSILTVAAGAFEGFSTVYRGLETSASILGKNLSENTVKIVEYKYGPPAAELASNTLGTGGNVWVMYRNTKYFTPKGVVKGTAKETGKAMVVDKRPTPRTGNGPTTVAAADLNRLYPDLQHLHQMEESTPSISLVNSFVPQPSTSGSLEKNQKVTMEVSKK